MGRWVNGSVDGLFNADVWAEYLKCSSFYSEVSTELSLA